MPRARRRGSKQGPEGSECLGSHTLPAPCPVPVFSVTVVITDASTILMTVQWLAGHSRLSFRVWSHLFAGAAGLPLGWITSRLAQTSGAVEEILDRENKRMADSLASKVTRLKSLALDIDRDTEDQNRYLDGMDKDVSQWEPRAARLLYTCSPGFLRT
ncbi:BET1-like protein isoform X2 [Mastomys coucha]|uniref:BET1-like protein isoform X2 n=1 Tax=Mastomys coucha TaxID=35658 RepID=UPI00126288F3|nr:BET1-like protein isoform X2 [Mastomys coucha]